MDGDTEDSVLDVQFVGQAYAEEEIGGFALVVAF